MAASFGFCVESNLDTSAELKQRKKRRKLTHETQNFCTRSDDNKGIGRRRWRTDAEQQIYSTKLLEALRKSPRNSTALASAKGIDVRETADQVLAVAAKGTTRWSRAILTSRRSLRVRKVRKVKGTGNGRLKRRENNRLPAVEKKMRVLSRLVPGCRKASFTSLLEETSDYIAALEMQVRAMTALTQILAATGGGGSSGAPNSE